MAAWTSATSSSSPRRCTSPSRSCKSPLWSALTLVLLLPLGRSNILEKLGTNDHIVRYYERFVDKPSSMLYILMEYCAGGDLAGVITRCRKNGQSLPEDVVWTYLAQITLALHDCHSETDSQGRKKPVILHRDIKPENGASSRSQFCPSFVPLASRLTTTCRIRRTVFLDENHNLKLGDFGLSKAMEQAAMTQTYVGVRPPLPLSSASRFG